MDEGDEGWACGACTLVNEESAQRCGACGLARGSEMAESSRDSDSDGDYDYLDSAQDAQHTVDVHVARRKWCGRLFVALSAALLYEPDSASCCRF